MKNVIILKNRGFDQYDFKELKEKYELNLSIITFKKSYENLPHEILAFLDKVYILNNVNSEFDSPLPTDGVNSIIGEAKHKNTWIVAADELNVLTAAALREKRNLIGSPSSVIANYRDKARQTELLSNAGIRTPAFVPFQKPLSVGKIKVVYNSILQILKLPFILKPVDMGGTTAVEQIKTYEEFCHYFQKYSAFSNFIAEELINGQLYHCDFIIQEGNYIFSEASEYIYNGLAFVNGLNHGSLILLKHDFLREPIINFCKKANSVLGLKSGCAHFEVFVTQEGEIIFLEAAARPAGSIVPLVFTKTFEKNYLNAALLAEIGEDPGIFSTPTEYYFWAYFPKKQGIIKKLNHPSLRSPYDLNWLVNINDVSKKSISVSEKTGFLLARNKDYETLRSDFHSLRQFEAMETE